MGSEISMGEMTAVRRRSIDCSRDRSGRGSNLLGEHVELEVTGGGRPSSRYRDSGKQAMASS